MHIFKGDTFAECYKLSLQELYNNPDYQTSPRGLKIHEMLNTAFIINNPARALYVNDTRSSKLKYISAELIWYYLGRDDSAWISKYAKFWDSISQNGKANSAYGARIFSDRNTYGYNQYSWALNSLLLDKDSRQAVMFFNNPEFQYDGNSDFVCTLNAIFNIRDNKLNMTVQMRSNDCILGTPTDVAFFSTLQMQLKKHLTTKYPDLQIGTYTHIVNSYHLYERNFDIVKTMLDSSFDSMEMPELDIDLINSNGNPSTELLDFHESSYNNTHNSGFLNWIQTHIR